jgi:hypothetical protein
MLVGTASLELQPQISAAARFVTNTFHPAVGPGFLAMVYTNVAVSLISWMDVSEAASQPDRQTDRQPLSSDPEQLLRLRSQSGPRCQNWFSAIWQIIPYYYFLLAMRQCWMDKLSEFHGPHPIPSVAPATIANLQWICFFIIIIYRVCQNEHCL